MSDMRLGLIGLGILFVLAVWIFNKIQERRLRKNVEAPFTQTRRDILLERERRGEAGESTGLVSEPSGSLRSEPSFSGSAPGAGEHGTEPHFGVGESGPGDAGRGLESSVRRPVAMGFVADDGAPVDLDEEIHALIALHVDQPVSGDRVLACLQTFRHAGRQTVQLLGAQGSRWYPVRTMERYESLRIAIQLANRSGPLNEVEFSEFVTRLENAADQIPAGCDVPDMMETIARARSLDACCAPLDAQIGLTLANPQGVWSGELLAQEAQRLGMVLRSDGRFHALAEDGAALFVLQNADGPAFRIDNLDRLATRRVAFVLDLPRAAQAHEPYARMTQAAQGVAQPLGAIIVDDQLRTLTPTMLETIARQIEPVYAKLDAAGLPAGSARALALFS